MKSKGRHVIVVRQEVVHEQRNVVDTLCFNGTYGTPDQRHSNHGHCLPIRLQVGEKALVLGVDLLYCTNDTDREWRFELQGELWDGKTGPPLNIVVPPRAKGAVPALDRLVYRNEVVAKFPEFVQYLGQEHAILGAHSTCVDISSGIGFQLFREKDPFLQFLRNHWSNFPELSEFDIQLVENNGSSSEVIYQVSQRAVDRATHFFKTVFARIHYKTRESPLSLRCPEQERFILPGDNEAAAGTAFSGVVIMLSLDYVIVAPAAPKCRIMDYPLNLIII